MNTFRRTVLGSASAALLACTPALNWRQVEPAGAGLQALLPCKPVHRARPLNLAGRNVEFTVDACEADGITWALAFADLRDPTLVSQGLSEMKFSAERNIGAAPAPGRPASIPGATPQPGNLQLRLEGRLPSGAVVVQEAMLFARGTTIFQASAVGTRLPPEPLAMFFESLRFVR